MTNCTVFQTASGFCGLVGIDSTVSQMVLPVDSEMQVICQIEAQWGIVPDRCDSLFTDLVLQIQDYFQGIRIDSWHCSVDIAGCTPFQRRVLEAVKAIPYGQVMTYKDVAIRAGSPMAARAVGQVMAHNRIPLIIPCHRVLASHGGLGGFSSPHGPQQKKTLLMIEGHNNL